MFLIMSGKATGGCVLLQDVVDRPRRLLSRPPTLLRPEA